MKEKIIREYTAPEAEIFHFNAKDVISTSQGLPDKGETQTKAKILPF